jgi:hypothetical protein
MNLKNRWDLASLQGNQRIFQDSQERIVHYISGTKMSQDYGIKTGKQKKRMLGWKGMEI